MNTKQDVATFFTMRESNGDTEKKHALKDPVWLKTLKATSNLLSHIFIGFVVLICLWFSCRSTIINVMELHIVLCVLGYQFFMSQGILVLSKFNSWSMHLKHRHRRCLHWFLEFVGAVLIIVGSVEVIKHKEDHFNSLHGILGLCALLTTVISILNGMVTSLSPKLVHYGFNFTTASKSVHGVTGIGTLFLSAASLHYGYDKVSFRSWIDNENVSIVLKTVTWMFTTFVSFEFWIIMYKRIKCRSSTAD